VASVNELYPTALTVEDLDALEEVSELKEVIGEEALRHYEAREAEFGPEAMRQVERQVMLRVIDTRWREHLYEMDYLQDGIHLRAMGQKDPLVEWQREGYAMFTDMVDAIAGDFVKYVMHLQVVKEAPDGRADEVRDVQTSGPEDPGAGERGGAPGGGRRGGGPGDGPAARGRPRPAPAPNAPLVRSPEQRVGRNDPCPCGSGKKFKMCHGR
jgi:preprotein translocase subunit SecA